MPRPEEGKKATARTSASLAKLNRIYGYYVMDCVQNKWEIMPITRFYYLYKGTEVPTSRLFEAYLRGEKKEQEE